MESILNREFLCILPHQSAVLECRSYEKFGQNRTTVMGQKNNPDYRTATFDQRAPFDLIYVR